MLPLGPLLIDSHDGISRLGNPPGQEHPLPTGCGGRRQLWSGPHMSVPDRSPGRLAVVAEGKQILRSDTGMTDGSPPVFGGFHHVAGVVQAVPNQVLPALGHGHSGKQIADAATVRSSITTVALPSIGCGKSQVMRRRASATTASYSRKSSGFQSAGSVESPACGPPKCENRSRCRSAPSGPPFQATAMPSAAGPNRPRWRWYPRGNRGGVTHGGCAGGEPGRRAP